MKTLLTFDLIEGRKIRQSRQQWSRSWTRGLMQLLYVNHARILGSAPYAAIDIMGQTRNIDNQAQGDTFYKGNMLLTAPGGGAGLFVPSGSAITDSGSSYTKYPNYSPLHYLMGQSIGVVVGVDGTAVTPTDFALTQRLFHGRNAAAAPGTTFDNISGADTSLLNAYSTTNLFALYFIPIRGFRLSSFTVLLGRSGSPGTCTATLCGIASAPGNLNYTIGPELTGIVSVNFNGNTLAVGSPWTALTINLPTPVDINPGFLYAIKFSAPAGNSSNYLIGRVFSLASPGHTRYGVATCADGGNNWSLSLTNQLIWSLTGSANPEVEYGACEIFNLAVANPNASFSVRRLFTNNSGGLINVAECGMYMAGTKYVNPSGSQNLGQVYSFCVAHDVISPAIALGNGQVLQVTYTPQITV